MALETVIDGSHVRLWGASVPLASGKPLAMRCCLDDALRLLTLESNATARRPKNSEKARLRWNLHNHDPVALHI